MKEALRKRLLAAAVTLAATAGGGAYVGTREQPSTELLLAMELGHYYESSGKHIGTPYIDKLGKGQPWTVCAGVTGPEVDPARYYTPEDCRKLELRKYEEAAGIAKQALKKHWSSYNVWVRASFIDVAYNVPSALAQDTTLMRLALAGDLVAACGQMPRWVMGTVSGQKVRLPGLVDRRGATQELCAEWGRDGHFSVAAVQGWLQ